MKRFISTLFGLAVLCVFAQAQAVPATVSFTGRLTTSTGPVSGAVTVTFKLFDLSTNGTEQWSETRSLTATTGGLVYADLGAMTTLDSSILDNSPLFLEIHVGSEILTPRLPLQSVPYAIRSEVANTAETLGTIAPGDVVTTVNASGGISAARSGNTVTLTGTAVSGTAPIAVAAGNVSLTTCAANQVYKMTGGTWQCAADANTTYTAAASSGVVLNGTAFGLTTCANGQVLKAGATAGTWACGTDNDTTYSARANGGLTFNGTQIGLMTCSNGQVLKAGATAGTWACANDLDTDTGFVAANCTWARADSTTAVSTLDALCPAGKYPISGGCDAAGTASVTFTRPHGPPANGSSINLTIDQWRCQFSAAATGHTALALCCELD